MKFYMLKNYLTIMAIALAIPSVQAQFDDVYYDPDEYVPIVTYSLDEPAPANGSEGDVTYYDDDSYGYYDEYDDYDYYYSSRIRRFYRPYAGFGFYDPVYVGYNYYDPFAWDHYAYQGSNIYFSFGFGINSGFGWNNWYAPAPYYYGYNNWYYPSYSYWNGGYNPYGGHYNPYCPPHWYNGGGNGSGYYPGNGHDDHYGGNGDHYYGPRTAGNTGTSPRRPPIAPGLNSPTVKDVDSGITDSNDRPAGLPESGKPGRAVPSGTITTQPDHSPAEPAPVRQEATPGGVRQVPVDKELPRDQSTPAGGKRPVFKPDVEKYQPYPTPERTKPVTSTPGVENPSGKPSTAPKDNYRPNPGSERPVSPPRTDQAPSYTPPSRGSEDRPTYTPPQRSNSQPEQTSPERPSYSPPQRSNDVPRSNDRPSYSPPQRNNDAPQSNDRPSYSPPQRSNDTPRSGDRPSYSPSSSSGNSSPSGGGSSNRSSGGGSSSSNKSSSPRGRG